MKPLAHPVLYALVGALATCQPGFVAAAGSVYKCVGPDFTIAYQGEPCATGTAETRLTVAAATPEASVRTTQGAASASAPAAVPAPRTAGTTARASSRRALPWNRQTLELGMSDDEVLNLAGWGRPSRVTRARMPHEWHEDWAYRAPGSDEERRLHFVNTRLVAIDVEPAGEPPIHLTSQ